MIKIDPKSIILYANIEEEAIPGASLVPGNNLVHLHLTQNKDKALRKILGGPGIADELSAINIKAAFAVSATSPTDNLATWKFQFMQVAKTTINRWVYAGRTATGGSVSMDLAFPPAVSAQLASEFLLDTDPHFAPFVESSTPTMLRRTSGDIWIETQMHDHPSAIIPLQFPNGATKQQNFLIRVIKDFYAVTTLVAVDDKGKSQPLAHVNWEILWDVSFQWINGTCRPVMRQKEFSATAAKLGPPVDPTAARLVANPPTDPAQFYNAVFHQAKYNVLKVKDDIAMSESKEWVPGIAEGPLPP